MIIQKAVFALTFSITYTVLFGYKYLYNLPVQIMKDMFEDFLLADFSPLAYKSSLGRGNGKFWRSYLARLLGVSVYLIFLSLGLSMVKWFLRASWATLISSRNNNIGKVMQCDQCPIKEIEEVLISKEDNQNAADLDCSLLVPSLDTSNSESELCSSQSIHLPSTPTERHGDRIVRPNFLQELEEKLLSSRKLQAEVFQSGPKINVDNMIDNNLNLPNFGIIDKQTNQLNGHEYLNKNPKSNPTTCLEQKSDDMNRTSNNISSDTMSATKTAKDFNDNCNNFELDSEKEIRIEQQKRKNGNLLNLPIKYDAHQVDATIDFSNACRESSEITNSYVTISQRSSRQALEVDEKNSLADDSNTAVHGNNIDEYLHRNLQNSLEGQKNKETNAPHNISNQSCKENGCMELCENIVATKIGCEDNFSLKSMKASSHNPQKNLHQGSDEAIFLSPDIFSNKVKCIDNANHLEHEIPEERIEESAEDKIMSKRKAFEMPLIPEEVEMECNDERQCNDSKPLSESQLNKFGHLRAKGEMVSSLIQKLKMQGMLESDEATLAPINDFSKAKPKLDAMENASNVVFGLENKTNERIVPKSTEGRDGAFRPDKSLGEKEKNVLIFCQNNFNHTGLENGTDITSSQGPHSDNSIMNMSAKDERNECSDKDTCSSNCEDCLHLQNAYDTSLLTDTSLAETDITPYENDFELAKCMKWVSSVDSMLQHRMEKGHQ